MGEEREKDFEELLEKAGQAGLENLLLIKLLGEELLQISEPGYREVIMELLSYIDELGIEEKVEPSPLFKRFKEMIEDRPDMKRTAAIEIYPLVKNLIESAYLELKSRTGERGQGRASSSPS